MAEKTPFQVTASRFVHAVKDFASSEVGWKAKLIFAGLVILLLAERLNVEQLRRPKLHDLDRRPRQVEFTREASFYIGVFGFTVVAVIARFARNALDCSARIPDPEAVSIDLADGAHTAWTFLVSSPT